jgi:DtxR family Mn-dependent transcriptional regulator
MTKTLPHPTTHPASHAIEDYVKTIYALQSQTERNVTTKAIAQRLNVTPASASAMVKKLGELGFVKHQPYYGVKITENGSKIALAVIRHHRLLELYLQEALGMSWDKVHAQAEILEHALTDELAELIATKLGNPTHDPHGDPIPTRELQLIEPNTVPLASVPVGTSGTLIQVSDRDPAVLRYLSERKIARGDRFEVLAIEPFDGPTVVRFGSDVHHLPRKLAEAMNVELHSDE